LKRAAEPRIHWFCLPVTMVPGITEAMAGCRGGRDRHLKADSKAQSPHDALFFYHNDILEGVRVGRYKYYRKINLYKYPAPVNKKLAGMGAGKLVKWPLLYDLTTDSSESYNLADNQPEIVAQMEKIMQLWEKQIG